MPLRYLLALLLLAAIPVRSGAASLETAEALRQAALADPWPYHFLDGLTTEIGQRLAGTDAEARAADWVMAQLKGEGFENIHREPVPMTAWVRGIETGEVVA